MNNDNSSSINESGWHVAPISPIDEHELLAAQQCAERAESYGARLDAAIVQFVRERLWKLSVQNPHSPEFASLLRTLLHHWRLETMGNRRKRSVKNQERLVRHLFGSLPEVVPFAESQQINTHEHPADTQLTPSSHPAHTQLTHSSHTAHTQHTHNSHPAKPNLSA